jgi:hypothetical protein
VGNQVEPNDQIFTITAAQLAITYYVSGSAGGTDQLGVRALDGAPSLDGWASFELTSVPDSPPVVTAPNVSAKRHQTFAISSLFTTNDPDGDPIAQYALYDFGTGGGNLSVNGVLEPANQEIDLTPQQLLLERYQIVSGTDTLYVRANDGSQWGSWQKITVTAPIDTPPIVTASNLTALHGQTFAGSSLFSASDSDGDGITQYALWDLGSGGGYLTVGGVFVNVNAEIDLTPAQLQQTVYHSRSGADTLWARAYDGTQWSGWTEFTVTAPVDQPPVVTASNQTGSKGQKSFAAGSLFSVSDAEGDPIVTYGLWNTGTGGGLFVVNGVGAPSNQEIDVTLSRLQNTYYEIGSATDQLSVRANDGYGWGAWTSFKAGPWVDTPPTVTAANELASHRQTFAASSLFAAHDTDTDSITKYALWDTGSGGAYLAVGGVSEVGAEIDLTLSQLQQTVYHSGSGADTLWGRAYDGSQWSAWTQFTVTGPVDQAPVVSGLFATGNRPGYTWAALNLFSANDPDGDAITQYRLENVVGPINDPGDLSGQHGGYWEVNGVQQPASTEFIVSAQNINNTVYVAGDGPTDTVWAQAYDGYQWSNWWSASIEGDTAPVITGTQSFSSARPGQTVAASSLFTAKDVDGDSITGYALWDAGGGGGAWVVNGQALPDAQWNNITPQQLQSAYYKVGTGPEGLYADAADPFGYGPISAAFGFTGSQAANIATSNGNGGSINTALLGQQMASFTSPGSGTGSLTSTTPTTQETNLSLAPPAQ